MKLNTFHVDRTSFNHCAIMLGNNDQENSTFFLLYNLRLDRFPCSVVVILCQPSTTRFLLVSRHSDGTTFFPELYVDNSFIYDHLGPWKPIQKSFLRYHYQSDSTHWTLPEKHFFPDYWRQMGCTPDILLSLDLLYLDPNIHPEEVKMLWSTKQRKGSDQTTQIYCWESIYEEGEWNKLSCWAD